MLKIRYEGVDITYDVDILKCIHREASSGRADTLDIEFDHAAAFHRWGPREDDRIEVARDGYSTGTLYIDSLIPCGERYRILATSLPSAAKRTAWQSYQDESFKALMHRCAVECGMGDGTYGLDGDWRYAYLTRRDEGCAAFLNRLGEWEGMAIKAVNGSMRAVYVPWAQRLAAQRSLWIDTTQDGVEYLARPSARLSALTVCAPGIRATARDAAATAQSRGEIALPAHSAAEAGRWARGLLSMRNRQAERLKVKSKFDPGMTAMIRVDVEGGTAADGEWIIDEAEHDMKNDSTEINLLRCIESVE